MELGIDNNNFIEFRLTSLTPEIVCGSIYIFLVPNDLSDDMWQLVGESDVQIKPKQSFQHFQSVEEKDDFNTPEFQNKYFSDKNMRIKFEFEIDEDDK